MTEERSLKLVDLMENISTIGVWGSGVLLLAMSIYICLDVLLRKFLSISIRGDVELSEYVLAIMSGWAFSYAMFKKAHVRIDVLYIKFSVKWRVFLDIASLIALIIFMAPTVYYSYYVFHTSVIRNSVANTPLQTPLWIPQGAWFVGLAFFLIAIIVTFVVVITKVVKKDILSAYKLAGSASVVEEIKEESVSEGENKL